MITQERCVQRAVVEIDSHFCQARRMRTFNIIATFTIAALFAAPAAYGAAEVYRFDPVHTQIWFTADHQRFSHPQGRLRVKDGWFQFDEKDWSTARAVIEIDMTSADMGDAKWSNMVRSGQFLDAERWPTARFISKSVDKKDDKTGVIHGDLTLHGETKPFDVEFTVNRIGNDPYQFKQKAGFSAKAEVHRSDFGIKRYAEVVGENIELRFEIEGIPDRRRRKPEEKPAARGEEGGWLLKSGVSHWGSVAKFFHWTIVFLILVQATIGLVMVQLPKRPERHSGVHRRTNRSASRSSRWRCCGSAGGSSIRDPRNRSACRIGRRSPRAVGHALLYALIFAVPLSGWLFDSASALRPLYWFGLFQVPSLTGGPDDAIKDFAKNCPFLAVLDARRGRRRTCDHCA